MKRLIILFVYALSLSTNAQEMLQGKIVQRNYVPEIPSFFFKVSGDGLLISYTAPTPGRRAVEPGQNKILQTQTNETFDIPGPHDPVFIGDTNLLITPTIDHSKYEIYHLDNLLRNSIVHEPLTSFAELKGFYQSAGILSWSNNTAVVRVIAEWSADLHSVIDFTYDSKSQNFKLLNSTKSHLCSNVKIKLPMLSKDGTLVGGQDIDTGTSGIWKIEINYSCTKILDLGMRTGKLNFDYSNSKVAYHIYKKADSFSGDQADNYIPHPENSFVSDVFVFDLKTLELKQITGNASSNSMYPDFTKDGRLVFINHPHDSSMQVSFNFVEI